MFGGGGEVASDGAELFCAGECAQAAGYLLPEFDHADFAFGSVVVKRYSEVVGEAQVVVLAVEQTAGQRVVLLHDRVGARGGVGDADPCGRAVELDLLGQRLGSMLAGPRRSLRPPGAAWRPARRMPGWPSTIRYPVARHRPPLEFSQHVGAAELMRGVEVGVVGRPGVVHRDAVEPASTPASIPPLTTFGVAGDQGLLAGRAQWTQCSSTTPAARSRRTRRLGLVDPPAHGVEEAVQPAGGAFGHRRDAALGIGVPNSSASACAVRFFDRNCPTSGTR